MYDKYGERKKEENDIQAETPRWDVKKQYGKENERN